VALVIHGILDSSDSFAIADDSVINKLLELGYEVWAGNNRGTKYSCTHQTLDNKSPEYWDFSFEDMARDDVPAFYKKVLEETKVQKITLISHSQGGTQSFAALASSQEIQDQTELFIALAPVLYMNRFPDNPNIFYWLAKFKVPQLFQMLGINYVTFVDIGQNPIIHFIIDLFCNKTSFVCEYLFHLTTDKQAGFLDLEKMPYYLSYDPSGTSRKAFQHFTQLMFTKDPKFQMYDYGKAENVKKYGTESPPVFDISKIKTKTAIFYGENDNLCTLENVAFINDKKKDCINFYMDRWGHLEYTWGKDKSVFLEKFERALKL
jgi:lysosomal acid lipase/cholesteryl ester hydrolase